uniref:SAP domain-containing protein n=1 Tax=Pelagomonas calceolata TaxID=35677 RepID=A0A7S4A564_9STRA
MLSVVVAAWGGWLSFQALKARKARDDVEAEDAAVRKVLRFWACYAFLLAYDAYGCLTWVPGHSLARAAAVGFVFLLPPAWGATEVAFFVGLLPTAHASWAVAHGAVFSVLAVAHDLAAECARPGLFSPKGRAPKTPLKTPPARDARRRIAELLRDSDDSDDEEPASCVAEPGTPRVRPTPRDPCESLDSVASAPSSPGLLRGWSREVSSDDDFDADAATRAAKKLRVAELRAALEAAGADSKGLKPALVERLVGVRRRAASGPTLSPVAFSETDDDPPPRASPAKRVWGLRRRFSPRKLRTRRPRAAALSPGEPSQ